MNKLDKLKDLVAINKVIEAHQKRKFELLTEYQTSKDPETYKEFNSLCDKLNSLLSKEREMMDCL